MPIIKEILKHHKSNNINKWILGMIKDIYSKIYKSSRIFQAILDNPIILDKFQDSLKE